MRTRFAILTTALLLGIGAFVGQADGAGGWVRLALQQGHAEQYRWAAGALLPRDSSMQNLCVTLYLSGPPASDGVALGYESTECGVLGGAADAVTGSVSAGSGPSRATVIERLYEPSIRKVEVRFDNGSEKRLRLQAPRRASADHKGGARFRYFVLPIFAWNCVRSVTSLDADGDVVGHEPGAGCLR
jgi:hypothetical protein